MIISGIGTAMMYAVSNALPVQYFSSHAGLGNEIIKLGGGVVGCVIALKTMYRRAGVSGPSAPMAS